MIYSNVLRKRVLAVINEKINVKQKSYDEQCKQMDLNCVNEIKKAKSRKIDNKVDLLDKMVEDIVGKIIE